MSRTKGPMEAMSDLIAFVEAERYNVKLSDESWCWIMPRTTFDRLYEDMIAVSRGYPFLCNEGFRGRTKFMDLPIIVSPKATGISLYDSTPEPVQNGMSPIYSIGYPDPKGGLWIDTWTGIARLKGSQVNLFELFRDGAVFA